MTPGGDGADGQPFPRFLALDSWRGLAALGVVAGHARALTPLFGSPFFAHTRLFVDLFFVLSGFVIAGCYGDRLLSGFSRSRFLWLRLGRIHPVHFAVLMAAVFVEVAVLLTGSDAVTGRQAFGEGRELPQLLAQLALVQVLSTSAIYAWTLQSWSISSEWMLYLFAALCWRPLGRRWWLGSLVLGLAAGIALYFPAAEEWSKLLRGFAGFGLGVGACIAWRSTGARLAAIAPLLATMAELALVAGVVAGFRLAPPVEPYLLFDILFVALVLVFAAERGAVSALLRTRPFTLLGMVSYSLYMVHTQAMSAFMRLLARVLPDGWMLAGAVPTRPPFAPALGGWGDLGLAVVLGGIVAVAWACYHLIERPARDWSRRRVGHSPEIAREEGLPVI